MPRTIISTSPLSPSMRAPNVSIVQFRGPTNCFESHPSSTSIAAANRARVQPSALRRRHRPWTASNADPLTRAAPCLARSLGPLRRGTPGRVLRAARAVRPNAGYSSVNCRLGQRSEERARYPYLQGRSASLPESTDGGPQAVSRGHRFQAL
jgi:hypothetical protein